MALASESAPFRSPRAVGGAWVLRVLFPATLSWALLVLFAEELFAWMPQGSSGLLEAAVVLGVTGLCILLAPFHFAVLAALAGGAWYQFMLSREDPANPQYGVSAVFAAILYPCAVTPVFTGLLTRITARGPRGDRASAGAHR